MLKEKPELTSNTIRKVGQLCLKKTKVECSSFTKNNLQKKFQYVGCQK